jgi:hypothetical protein
VIRRISLALYGISLVPIGNISTFVVILALTMLFEVLGLLCLLLPLVCAKAIIVCILPSRPAEGRAQTPEQLEGDTSVGESLLFRRILFYTSIASMAIIMVILVVNTEQMIHSSSSMIQPGESDWTFGQTLAVLLLIFPFWQAVGDIRGTAGERS